MGAGDVGAGPGLGAGPGRRAWALSLRLPPAAGGVPSGWAGEREAAAPKPSRDPGPINPLLTWWRRREKGPSRSEGVGCGGRRRPPRQSPVAGSCARRRALEGGGGPLSQSLFRFPRGTSARRRLHSPPPLPLVPAGNPWGNAPGWGGRSGSARCSGSMSPIFRAQEFPWRAHAGVTPPKGVLGTPSPEMWRGPCSPPFTLRYRSEQERELGTRIVLGLTPIRPSAVAVTRKV